MKRILFIAVIVLLGATALTAIAAGILSLDWSSSSKNVSESPTQPQLVDTPQTLAKPYEGQSTHVGDAFVVTVPNGWSASISTTQSFLAIMFARPQKLDTLSYNASTPPSVDTNGIPSWSGLTEHFYIRYVSTAQSFNPANHQEVSSEQFTFDDGTIGTKYFVVKHAAEAAQYGGLIKDDEWQGRTYIYEKDNRRVEAHLAVYPSSGYDIDFYEHVVRTVSIR